MVLETYGKTISCSESQTKSTLGLIDPPFSGKWQGSVPTQSHLPTIVQMSESWLHFFYSYFGHCLSVYPWLNFGLSPRRPQVVWGPLRWDWAIFCHIGLGLRSRVWSAREKSLEILRHGRQLNPAMERTDRETHSFSHWAIMIRATERTDSEIHSFSNWAIVTDLLIAWILYVCLTTKLNTCDSGWVPIPCLHNSRFDRLHKTNPSSSLLRISMTGQLSGVVQVPRRCPVQCQEFAGALDSCQEWCRNWPIES